MNTYDAYIQNDPMLFRFYGDAVSFARRLQYDRYYTRPEIMSNGMTYLRLIVY